MKELNDPRKLPSHMHSTYNAFVDAATDVLFEKVEVQYGFNRKKREVLHFTIEISGGLSDEEAARHFGNFIEQFPDCGINYNKAPEPTVLEKVLYDKSQTVMYLRKGFKLERI